MVSQRVQAIAISTLGTGLLLAACSANSRYRVLSFFFDGVPPPGASGLHPTRRELAAAAAQRRQKSEQLAAVRRPIYAHRPYRDHRCRACHNPENGLLYKTVSGGLCQTCHKDVPGSAAYLHGPVAVNDCLACHNPHWSHHPNVLLDDPRVICFRCHERSDLKRSAHPDEGAEVLCIECHNPHGGDNRFFLKRQER